MKKMYWKLHGLSRLVMIFMCLFSLLGVFAVEHFKKLVPQNHYAQNIAASELAARAMSAIKTYRIEKKIPIDLETDPQNSGMIGDGISIVTSEHGQLSSKQTSVNPNIAAVISDWLIKAHVKRGDTVAIGMTGSFPALNISVLAAIKASGLNPIIIASAASSQWGANIPGLLWLDMANVLNQQNIISYRPIAASLGGIDDRAKGIPEQGKSILLGTIKRYNIPLLDSNNAQDAIEKRMALYESHSAGARRIKAYINIGGGTASVGRHHTERHHLKPGLSMSMPITLANDDSVMIRFLKRGVPVINLSSVFQLARNNDLPLSPTTPPAIGRGSVFFHEQYDTYLALGVLVATLLFLIVIAALSREIFRQQHDVGTDSL